MRYYIITLLVAISALAFISCDSYNERNDLIESDYCSEKLGCINKKVVDFVKKSCRDNDVTCLIHFEKLLGDLDNIYFVDRMAVDFEECRELPIPRGFIDTNAELCRYVLFEKNKKIKGYIRGSCMSEIKKLKNNIYFDSNKVDLISVMSANIPLEIKIVKENTDVFYYISLDKKKINNYRSDGCVGLK